MVTPNKEFYCANPRITVDPRSHYRQAEILTQYDLTQMSSQERIAQNANLKFSTRGHQEGGNIGQITNGTGASMALDDLIASFGGRTASYLDLHGDSAIEDVHEGLALLEFDKRVKCIAINLFCGQFEIIPFVRALVRQRQMEIQTKPIVLRIKGAMMEEA